MDLANVVPMNIRLREDAVDIAAIMPLRFWTEHETVIVPAKGDQPERIERVAHDWVHWAKKGVSIPQTNVDKVKRIMKDHPIWAALGPHYKNWKEGSPDMVAPGQTPLEAWGGVTRDEIEALRPFRIYSVEDFAAMNDAVMSKIPFRDIGAKRDRAKKFLETQKTADEVKAVLGDENAKLKKQLEEMQAMMAQMQSSMQGGDGNAKPAKTRKAREEATAA